LNEQTKTNYTAAAGEAQIFLAASIEEQQLEHWFNDLITEQAKIFWNADKQKVESVIIKSLGKLQLKRQNNPAADILQLQQHLFAGIKMQGLDCLPWNKASINLKQRINFLHYQRKRLPVLEKQLESTELPMVDDAQLRETMAQWLLPHLSNETSIKQLQSLDMERVLSAMINWDSLKLLNDLAPQTIKVPSGSTIRIDYNDPAAPVLAVRLQELFGLQETPAILKGVFPLTLHLLSPAFRPMQVTRDLSSFWKNTYNDVKKELKGKYKKHYWPDNPLEAQATNRAKPKKQNH
jgi:ATP-dependent helicase HrpB